MKAKITARAQFMKALTMQSNVKSSMYFMRMLEWERYNVLNLISRLKGSIIKITGVLTYVEKYSMVIATNLTSICCVYEEKIVKND